MKNIKFLVDESLGNRFSVLLASHGYNSVFVGNIMRSAPDDEILSFSEKENFVIATDDKDFGELVFRFKKSAKGVILFRTSATDPAKLFEMVKGVLNKSEGRFIVVKEGQIKIRDLK